MVQILPALLLATTLLPLPTLAHGHFKRDNSISNKRVAADGAVKMAQCASIAQSVKKRTIQRRAQTVEKLREERGFTAADGKLGERSLEEIAYCETVEHNFTTVLKSTSYEDVFGTNASCILGRGETLGPYYVEGERIRRNITEGQAGIPIHLQLQFIDINTCLPVPALFIDIWSANGTGGYSGAEPLAALGSLGIAGLNTTFLRGVQITDEHGVASFDYIVPGHYSPRTAHSHIAAWGNATTFVNGTMAGGLSTNSTYLRHVGQLYFEQKLLNAVELLPPYSMNLNADTTNFQDTILTENTTVINGNTMGDLGAYDPFLKYMYLTKDLKDGIFAWHTIGVDMNADFNKGYPGQAAAKLESEGGRALNSFGDGTWIPDPNYMGPPKGTTTTVTASATPV